MYFTNKTIEYQDYQLDEVLFYVTNPGSGESISYLIGDHLNSPAARLDSTGSILERYEYDAYGKRHVFNELN